MAFSPVDPDILISGCKQNKAEHHRVVVWNIKRESLMTAGIDSQDPSNPSLRSR